MNTKLPERMIYAVSDIHGCYDKYKTLMDIISKKQEG